MTSVSILGSTGSIGCSTLKVIEHLGDIRVTAMAAGRNMSVFAQQIAEFKPELVSCEDEGCAETLESELHTLGAEVPRIVLGQSGIVEVATHERAETVVSATVGAVGFVPTLRAIEADKRIALANKETLVMADELMTAAAAKSGAADRARCRSDHLRRYGDAAAGTAARHPAAFSGGDSKASDQYRAYPTLLPLHIG